MNISTQHDWEFYGGLLTKRRVKILWLCRVPKKRKVLFHLLGKNVYYDIEQLTAAGLLIRTFDGFKTTIDELNFIFPDDLKREVNPRFV